MGYPGSALDRACGDALDDVLLAAQVEDNNRDDAQHDKRHRRAHIDRAVAALEVLDHDRDRAVFRPVEHEVGK